MFDKFGELEVSICEDERALGGTVQVLRTMARQVDPFTISHSIKHAFDSALRILNNDNVGRALSCYLGYESDLLPGTRKR